MIADVVSAGARGPLGLSSRQVALCVRARKLEPRRVQIHDKRGQEIGIATTGGLGEHVHGYARLCALAAPALCEAASGLPDELGGEKTPLCLCLPEPGRADDDPRFTSKIVGDLAAQSGVKLDAARSTVVRQGQAGFAHALVAAKALLDAGTRVVFVGGVDSYYHPAVLQGLDKAYRLHAVGAEDGFIPSEGAAFLALTRQPRSAGGLGHVLDVETGHEIAAASEDEPNIALGMTLMLEALLARTGPILWSISDDNGESHRHDEWSKARRRAAPRELEETRIVWDTGDVGAASGPLFASIALSMMGLGCARSSRVLLALHSDGIQRGLVALEGPRHA